MQTLQLEKMGLTELSVKECAEVNGGGIWEIILRYAVLHFEEISSGLEAGWNIDKKKTK